MVPCRRDPPLPHVVWEVGLSRLPLGQPVVRLTIAGTTVFLPTADAARLSGALTTAATSPGPAARHVAAKGTPT